MTSETESPYAIGIDDHSEGEVSASHDDAVDAWLADETVVAAREERLPSSDVEVASGVDHESFSADAEVIPAKPDMVSAWLLRVALALIIVVLATAAAMVIFFVTAEKAPRTAVERDISAAEIAVRERPSDPVAWQTLAYAYASARRYDDAINTIRKARVSTKERALLLPEAEVLRSAGRHKEALVVYDEAIAALSTEESAAVAARKKQGISMAEPSAGLIRAYYGRGLARHATGDAPGAIADVLRAVELAPGQATMRVTLGDLYAERGNDAQAEAAYREALRYVPDYTEAKLGLERNLTSGEIAGQVVAVLKQKQVRIGRDRINLVFMGWFTKEKACGKLSVHTFFNFRQVLRFFCFITTWINKEIINCLSVGPCNCCNIKSCLHPSFNFKAINPCFHKFWNIFNHAKIL